MQNNYTVPDWLPDKKYYEYAYHKFFNHDIDYQNWQPWDEWTYPDRDILRFTHIIGNQLNHIRHKRVLDVACHLGYLTLFCLHNEAAFVTATNIRSRELSIAQEVLALTYHTNYALLLSDLNDETCFRDLCNQHDTILFSGIIYHISNHYEKLKSIYQSSADTLIIEGKQPDILGCCVQWMHESSDDPCNAFDKNKSTAFVGMPTNTWVESALIDIGWSIVYNETVSYTKPDHTPTQRYIITAKK